MTRTARPLVLAFLFGCSETPVEATTDGETGSAGTPGTTGSPEPTTSPGATSETTGPDPSGTSSDTTADPPETGSTTEPPPPMNGLRAEYFATYIDLVVDRVDPTLDFDWMDGPAAEGLAADRWSIRWTGWLLPPDTGTYTIITDTDDGVRVWIDDALVIDDWQGHFVTRNEAMVDLSAGVPAKIRVDYFEYDIAASARLSWASATLPEEVIPEARMLAADAPSGLPGPKPPYANPVEGFDCPDPGVLAVEGLAEPTFLKVCTGGSFPIRQSRDLVLWTDTGAHVLPNGKPAWAANGNRNWAPELHKVGGQYVAYFTTVNGANVLSIGAAYASDPLGPYAETAGPLMEHPLGVIDATYIEDNGAPFLIYKIDGNSQGMPTPMIIRQLAADGLSFVGDEVQVLVNDTNSWEGGVVEAPWIIKRDGFYYMFYSGNVYDHRYRTGVARASAVLGPYEKLGPPILGNNERWVGPGHGSVVQVEGLDYFVYHAWSNAGDGTHDGGKGRHDLVDRIVYENGWPKIHDGTPSRSPQAWPGVP
jgi:GH43 family beta-xylosidase